MNGARAEIHKKLAEGKIAFEVDGEYLAADRLQPRHVSNFFHVVAMRVMRDHYRQLAHEVTHLLEADPVAKAAEGQRALLALGRIGELSHGGAFMTAKEGSRPLIEAVKDQEFADLCNQVIAAYEEGWSYDRAYHQAANWVCEKALSCFQELCEAAMGSFKRLQPVLQVLMGRPAGPQIEQAIDDVEAVQDELDSFVAQFAEYGQAFGLAAEFQPDPLRPLTLQDNERKLARLNQYLAKVLPDHEAQVADLQEAYLRTAGMVNTLLTGIKQVDQRLATLGVTA